MTAPVATPNRRTNRGPGRPRNGETPVTTPAAPPSTGQQRRPKYIPGGPGGGGRYIDPVDGTEIPKEVALPLLKMLGRRHTASRPRPSRTPAAATVRRSSPVASPSRTVSRPRRDRPAQGPRSSSATAAASMVASQNEGYKPREERGWEEFHQDLDIEADFMVYSAEEVDGISPPVTKPSTPMAGLSQSHGFGTQNGASSVFDEAALVNGTPPLPTQESTFGEDEEGVNGGSPSMSMMKRRPGRPPRRPGSMLTGLGSPPAPRIEPLPTKDRREKLSLPRPSYRMVDPFAAYEQDQSVQVNYVDRTMANLGYQESDIFVRPEKRMIRLLDGFIEEDLDLAMNFDKDAAVHPVGRVEYDMDEQDDRWLDALNAARKQEEVEAIKPATFEITMTQIEKEWHALEKRIPKPNPKPPQTHRPRSSSAAAVNGEPAGQGEEQDTKCAVCDDGDCENTNAIVFCDGCDLAVHQECYGVPFIPEGQWLCRKCQLIGRGTPVSTFGPKRLHHFADWPQTCIFCPNVDGAFKQTGNHRWSHLLCAIWIPEVSLGNTTFMEPVQDVEKVPKQRWGLKCYICEQKMGACIQCGNKSCYQAFHVTCARRARLFLRMKSAHGGPASIDASVLKAFCHKHVPPDWKRENDVDGATADAMEFYRHTMRNRRWADSQQSALNANKNPDPQQAALAEGGEEGDGQVPGSNKRKRTEPREPPKNVWRLPSGAPIVPHIVWHNVEQSLQRLNIRKRKEFVAEACKYWTLKREARRGAALLKRLQLQMETFSSMEITRRNFVGMGAIGRPKLRRRIDFAQSLEAEMDQLKELCALTLKREELKLQDAYNLKAIVDTIYTPIPPLLWPILDKAQALDPKGVFKEGFDAIEKKLDEREYTSVHTFSADISAVFSAVIGVTTTSEDSSQVSRVPHKALTPEQKDRKKLAKRIIKAIQGPLSGATRKEAELGDKPYEKELRDLDALLNDSISSRPESALLNGEAVDEGSDDEVQEVDDKAANVAAEPEDEAKQAVEGATNGAETMSSEDVMAEMQLAAAQPTVEDQMLDAPNGRRGSVGTAPALSNSGSTNPSTGHPGPLTPPRSERDLLAPLVTGGVPWYFGPFDPVGTTIHDERWTGREVVSRMSEELSEIGDEELNGLIDTEMTDAPAVEQSAAGMETLTKAQLRKKQRNRNKSKQYWG
ncbi:hypothetical protein K490DRAFT_49545 [Saccharata proteae CBS 121410]|uniref:PHD finger domain-containing protein n=1 Tax=Saccharata proteae CBS 121410 TaxID=1314787 RepID=A0A9P4LS98_9PEZI|nr:hypothetical protein K490DRAFT_49545 [Saccharata proteae CBS 121410]